jgi:hypothetical protein
MTAFISPMKTGNMIQGVVFLGLVLSPFAPMADCADAPAIAPNVLVTFVHPENYFDIRNKYFATTSGEDRILSSLREYITRRAAIYLPEDYCLYVTFTNIKLAGAFPLEGIQEFRIITQQAPPGFVFGWAITDHSGKVIEEGVKRIENFGFMQLYGNNTSEGEDLNYEKATLDDWLRNTLAFLPHRETQRLAVGFR